MSKLTPPPGCAAIDKAIRRSGLLALVRCRAPIDTLLEAGDALLAAPVTAVAITPGSREPWDAVGELRTRFGRNMLIGAGPLAEPDQIDRALAAGAQFVLASRFDVDALQHCWGQGVFYLPGVRTGDELRAASAHGCSLLALFPPGREGPARLGELQRLTSAGLVPIGGVDAVDIGAYARAGAAAVGIRGVLPAGTRWSMAGMIRQVRLLRGGWDWGTED